MSELNFKRVATIKDGIVQNVFVYPIDEEGYAKADEATKTIFPDHETVDCTDWKDPDGHWEFPNVGWKYDNGFVVPEYVKGPITEESLAEAARLREEAEERRKGTVDENATQGVTQ